MSVCFTLLPRIEYTGVALKNHKFLYWFLIFTRNQSAATESELARYAQCSRKLLFIVFFGLWVVGSSWELVSMYQDVSLCSPNLKFPKFSRNFYNTPLSRRDPSDLAMAKDVRATLFGGLSSSICFWYVSWSINKSHFYRLRIYGWNNSIYLENESFVWLASFGRLLYK